MFEIYKPLNLYMTIRRYSITFTLPTNFHSPIWVLVRKLDSCPVRIDADPISKARIKISDRLTLTISQDLTPNILKCAVQRVLSL